MRTTTRLEGCSTWGETQPIGHSLRLVIPPGSDAEAVRTMGALFARGVHDLLKNAVGNPEDCASAEALWLAQAGAELCAMCFDALEVLDAKPFPEAAREGA